MDSLDEYFRLKPLSNLYISYTNLEETIEYLYYQDRKLDMIEASLKISDDKYRYWPIKINKKQTDCRIATDYITKNNIDRILNGKNSNIKYINFQNSDNKDHAYGFFTYNLSDKLQLSFNNDYELMIEENPKYKRVIVHNTMSDNVEYIHYLDDKIYIVEDVLDNSESIFVKGQNVKYEFKKYPLKLSPSNYLRYHQPYRVTNYTTNKQYVMEYDEHGIMTSMIDISNPEVNLCQHEENTLFNFDQAEIISVHPNIYNSFDMYELNPDFIESKEVIAEKYVNVNGYKVYKRHTILMK